MSPEIKLAIGSAVALAVATALVSFFRRRAKRTPETWDDDLIEAIDDGLDVVKGNRGDAAEEE
ncbi:MAG: hypothetical protein ACPG50_15860 [Pseudoalteromonas marina]